jgi:hypothetical protein
MFRRATLSLLCATLLLFQASCKKPESPQGQSAAPSSPSGALQATAPAQNIARPFRDLRDLPGTVFDVRYTAQTVRIDEASWRASLKSVSSDGNVLVFDNPDAQIQSLHQGSTMFLENLAVRTVLAATTLDGHFVVNTERAGLTDLIQNGTIHWKVPMSFASLTSANLPSPALPPGVIRAWVTGLSPEGVVYAASSAVNLSGNLDGWDYKINATPGSNRLDMAFAVHKELDSLIVNVDAKGFLKDFFSASDMHIQDGSLENFSYDATGLNGQLDINFEGGRGQGSTVGVDVPNIKLPPIYQAPMPIAGIPFVMTINANLILKPGFGGKNETMKGSFHINYNGDEGITVKAGQASASPGTLSGDGSLGKMLSVSIAPHAILVGMSAPKIALSLGTDSIADLATSALPTSVADSLSDMLAKTGAGKWAKQQFEKSFKTNASANVQNVAVATVTAQGSAGMIPCKLSRLLLEFKAGADAYLLGKKIGDKEVIIFKKELVNREPDINACGDK